MKKTHFTNQRKYEEKEKGERRQKDWKMFNLIIKVLLNSEESDESLYILREIETQGMNKKEKKEMTKRDEET